MATFFANPNLLPDNLSAFEGGSTAWVAGANTVASAPATEPLSGTRSMRLNPTAAGSVTATTTRFAVTPLAPYVFRAPLRPSTAVAGRVYTFTVTWYTLLSGGSLVSTSVSTNNLLSTSGTYSVSNDGVVIAAAPATATAATLTITVSGLAINAFVSIDDVYAGISPNRAGNLLDFNTSSIEKDATGWVGTNSNPARAAGSLYDGAGFATLIGTSAAAGDMTMNTATGVPVTAGSVYVAYAAIQPAAALSGAFEIRWFDAGAAQVGAADSRPWNSGASVTSRLALVATAPATAVTAKVYVRATATAAAQNVFIDDASFALAPNPAGNLLTYEEYSTESVLPAWTVNNAAITRDYLTSGITEGFYALRVTPAANTVLTAGLDRLIPVTPGHTYAVGAVMFRHNSGIQTISSACRTRVDWYDSSGALFAADNPDQFFTTSSAAVSSATTYTETRTCPAGAAFARVTFELDSTDARIDYWQVDSVTFAEAVANYDLVTNNDDGLITLTINYVPPTAGGVAAKVTVTRIDDDGKGSPMRGYGISYTLAPYSPGPLVIEDYEAPLGTRVWYSVIWYNAAGTVAGSRLLTRTVDAPVLADGDYVWFKSPGVPALNTLVQMEAPIKWARSARSATYDIVGRKNPVHVTGVRGGRASSLTLLVWDPSANELFDSLLDSGLPALVQAMPGYGLDGNTYLAIGDAEVEPLSPDARESGWRRTLAVTQIDRPDGGLQGSALSTWQTVLDTVAYATWEDIFNSHDTWAEVLTEG